MIRAVVLALLMTELLRSHHLVGNAATTATTAVRKAPRVRRASGPDA